MRQPDWTETREKDEVGWVVTADRWGEGLATEAAQAVLSDAFGRVGLLSVLSWTFSDNVASRRVMEKCGLGYRGTATWKGRDTSGTRSNDERRGDETGEAEATPGTRQSGASPRCREWNAVVAVGGVASASRLSLPPRPGYFPARRIGPPKSSFSRSGAPQSSQVTWKAEGSRASHDGQRATSVVSHCGQVTGRSSS